MIISKKKYKKINDDLVDAKAKVDDAKKALDDENKIMRLSLLIKKQRDQYKAERDTLIDDIAVLRANNKRLEQQNKGLQDENFRLNMIEDEADDKIKKLESENEKLVWTLKNKEDVIDWNCLKIRGLKEDVEKYKRGISNLANENDLKHNLLSEFSQHIGNKPSSSTYKYFRAKLDGIGIEEGE